MLLFVRFLMAMVLFGALACGDGKSDKKDDRPSTEDDKPAPKPPEKKKPAGCTTILAADEGAVSEKKAFVASLEWLDPIAANTPLRAKITITNPERCAPTALEDVKVEPFMEGMGHGIPGIPRGGFAPPVDPAVPQQFNASIKFNMGGPWDFRIFAKVNGQADKLVIKNINVP